MCALRNWGFVREDGEESGAKRWRRCPKMRMTQWGTHTLCVYFLVDEKYIYIYMYILNTVKREENYGVFLLSVLTARISTCNFI